MLHSPFVIAALLAALAQDPSPATTSPEPESVTAQTPEPEPDRPGLVKRTFRSFFEDKPPGGIGVHFGPFVPRLEIVSSGGGLGPGLHFWLPNIGSSAFDIHAAAAYSIYRYQHYEFQIGLVPHEGKSLPPRERNANGLFPLSDIEKTARIHGFNIYASGQYRDYPRERYFGAPDPGSLTATRSGYRLVDQLYEGIIRFRVSHLSVMARAGLLRPSIRPGLDSSFPSIQVSSTDATAPGLFRSPDFVHLSAGAWLEMRDEPANAHRGAAIGIALSRFDDRHESDFEFNRVTFDGREYIPLGSNRHVIALRQVASLDHPDEGSRVPFYLESTLGGNAFLRGYPTSRFRDDKLLALNAEYRFELRPKVEFALIYETGKVFHTMSQFDLGHLERSFGVGLRLKSPKRVRARLDVMHGAESTRVQVKLGPSF